MAYKPLLILQKLSCNAFVTLFFYIQPIIIPILLCKEP